MTLKEMLKEKEHYKKRVKELKEELDKYPQFLYLSTDDPMYDYLVGKHNALYDYEQSLETIKEIERDFIPKSKIRKLAAELNKETDWLFNEEGSWAYCEPFRNIAKKLEKIGR